MLVFYSSSPGCGKARKSFIFLLFSLRKLCEHFGYKKFDHINNAMACFSILTKRSILGL